ncbi:hypothetical protein BJ508DRAFT_35146 [Ascobolus immersus RN42]|uniref:Uncharacterized protein n=1 Tax=Ascobolus immersus RN42 TaxID=1160509 RepID=A0A3N4HNA2_ASCIM|nr:hypothetical protein BJ508DRAFT_35146 [Ascobolus immersus RN42]
MLHSSKFGHHRAREVHGKLLAADYSWIVWSSVGLKHRKSLDRQYILSMTGSEKYLGSWMFIGSWRPGRLLCLSRQRIVYSNKRTEAMLIFEDQSLHLPDVSHLEVRLLHRIGLLLLVSVGSSRGNQVFSGPWSMLGPATWFRVKYNGFRQTSKDQIAALRSTFSILKD